MGYTKYTVRDGHTKYTVTKGGECMEELLLLLLLSGALDD